LRLLVSAGTRNQDPLIKRHVPHFTYWQNKAYPADTLATAKFVSDGDNP
jgi:hypothetical protein